ncbi:ketopantoate reductase family protein [Lactonifactor longoviformis]|uniref:2-dehydropantoate 2-reductase n=1 Tax=Lactonifactor longoviformis DSM 17459 TaxID=1122155 RepID=A0A1M5C1C5_9CLOT|nr:ketopantoate reductase family protein [Lactonifactor longoviformis]POP30917.1 ketopantoate reductase family protein [Lactonifactor longoviformis]SHF48539.1 2-dehydropantoate 2-reductase [Lactonifactor longoviformis DSM 17459]
MAEIKTIGIIGQGALGVMYGQQLTRHLGKERVFFIADPRRIEKYQREGIYCNGEKTEFQYLTPDTKGVQADLLIFAVKYTAIEEALDDTANFVGDSTILLSLLNGIASEEQIGARYGEDKILYCVAQEMDALKEGNQFSHTNMGTLVIGNRDNKRDERLSSVENILREAEIPYLIPEDIMHCLWSKLMFNTGVNQTAAVYACNYRQMQEEGQIRDTALSAMEEARRIAEAEGAVITDREFAEWMQILGRLNPEGMPSMRQDTKAKRKTEVELFSGTLRKLGKKHHIPTPVNDWLYEKIQEIEHVREMGGGD